jgi:hypothetical protein
MRKPEKRAFFNQKAGLTTEKSCNSFVKHSTGKSSKAFVMEKKKMTES